MRVFENIPILENFYDLHKNLAECTEGIADSTRIIEYLQGLSHLSEVEQTHLRLAQENLYKCRALRVEICAHLMKFLN